MLKFILQTTVGKKYWLLSLNMCNWKMLTIMMTSCGTFFYWLTTDVRKHVSQARAQKSRNVACEQALCLRKGWKKKLNLSLPSPRDFFTLSPNREPVYMLVETQQILLFSSEECAAGKQESKSTFKLWPKILITLYRIPEYVLCKNILLVSKYTWPMRAKGKFPVDLSVFSCMGAQW